MTMKLCLRSLRDQLFRRRTGTYRVLFDPAQIAMATVCLSVAVSASFSCGPKRAPEGVQTTPPDRREQWRNAILGIQDGTKALNTICLKEVQATCDKDPTGTCAKNQLLFLGLDGGPGRPSDATIKATALAKTCADAFDATNGALVSAALIVDTFTFADVGRLACVVSRASAAAHRLASATVAAIGPSAQLPPKVIDGLKTADDFAAFVGGGCMDGK
jgi:hypothetical protein